MGKEQFLAVMPYISADLIGMIAKKKQVTEDEAIAMLYASKLYAALEPRSGSTARRCFIRFLNRKNKREVFAIPMCKEAAGMSQETAFAVFCIENYKVHKSLTGKQTEALFRRYGVFDYLREFYDVLHTTGYQYINNDIDIYLKSRNAVIPV